MLLPRLFSRCQSVLRLFLLLSTMVVHPNIMANATPPMPKNGANLGVRSVANSAMMATGRRFVGDAGDGGRSPVAANFVVYSQDRSVARTRSEG